MIIRFRAEYDHPEPYNVNYWSIGNENYGSWELGAKTVGEWGPRSNAAERC